MRHDQVEISGAPACPCSCSVTTSAAVVSVISSQAKRNVTRSLATNTSSTAPISTLKRGPEKSGPAAPVWASQVSKTEDGDGYRHDGEHEKKPGRQSVNRIPEREPGRMVHEQHAVHRRAAPTREPRPHRWRVTRPPTRATPDEVPRRAGAPPTRSRPQCNPQRQRKRQGTGEIEWRHVAVFASDGHRSRRRPTWLI